MKTAQGKYNEGVAKLCIGTVQFGLDYGISNRQGKTTEEEVHKILTTAAEVGVRLVDTAFSYGKSEEVLGRNLPQANGLQFVTKTPVYNKAKLDGNDGRNLMAVFHRSLKHLNKPNLYGLLIHNSDDLLAEGGGFLFEAMQELKEKGLVKKIGVSVYNRKQIDKIIHNFKVDLIQAPVNLLDQRLITGGQLEELKKTGVEVHIRSIFLQGLLLMAPEELPPHFASVQGHLKEFHADCKRNRISPIAACLDFAFGLPEADKVVIGVCSDNELQEILALIPQQKTVSDYGRYAWFDESILNPSLWGVQC